MTAKRYLAFCYNPSACDGLDRAYKGSFATLGEVMEGCTDDIGSQLDVVDTETEIIRRYYNATSHLGRCIWAEHSYDEEKGSALNLPHIFLID
jgi:hypothetical protein